MDSRPTLAREGVSVARAVLFVATVVVLVACVRAAADRERFVSGRAREVFDRAQRAFEEGGGDARYSDYKKRVPGADPVQYSDVRRLFREGRLSPFSVESAM